jgi:hypothetical protein
MSATSLPAAIGEPIKRRRRNLRGPFCSDTRRPRGRRAQMDSALGREPPCLARTVYKARPTWAAKTSLVDSLDRFSAESSWKVRNKDAACTRAQMATNGGRRQFALRRPPGLMIQPAGLEMTADY